MRMHHPRKPEDQMTIETLRASLDYLTIEELQLLEQELHQRLQDTPDWLDTEYVAYARKEGASSISLESVRAALAKIEGSMSDTIIEEREDRF
ncbi:TPA: hypothetical protein EYP66_15245 [Candidatus Poribacteria bacterium]|nr:hypothetical protein [Candidatus Poribacteria bacterium]